MSAAPARAGLRVVTGEETGSPYPKASLVLRFGARAVDVAIAFGIYQATGPAGAVMTILYLLFADAFVQGQSPGKKIFGVKVMHLPTRSAARNRDSVLRNAPFGFIMLLGMMPEPLGFRAFLGGLIVIGTIEALRVCRDPLGQRGGDGWAQTQVVDGKVVAGAKVAPRDGQQIQPERVMRAG